MSLVNALCENTAGAGDGGGSGKKERKREEQGLHQRVFVSTSKCCYVVVVVRAVVKVGHVQCV